MAGFLLIPLILLSSACGSSVGTGGPAKVAVTSIPPCPLEEEYNVAFNVNAPAAARSIQRFFALAGQYDGSVMIQSTSTQGDTLNLFLVMGMTSWNFNWPDGGGIAESNMGPMDKTGFLNALSLIPGVQVTCGVPTAPNPGVSGGTSN